MATTINTPIPYSEHATFSFTTNLIAPYKYQWKRDGVNLVHGSDKTYTTPPLRPEDFTAKYSVTVYGQDAIEESNSIAIRDTIPKAAAKGSHSNVSAVNQHLGFKSVPGVARPAHAPYTPERRHPEHGI